MTGRDRSGRNRKNLQRGHTTFSVSPRSATTAASARTSKHYLCLSLLLFARRSITRSLAVDLSLFLLRSVPHLSLPLSFCLFLSLALSLPPLSLALSLPAALSPSRGRAIRGSLTLRVSHALRVWLALALRVSLARYSSMSLSLSLSPLPPPPLSLSVDIS